MMNLLRTAVVLLQISRAERISETRRARDLDSGQSFLLQRREVPVTEQPEEEQNEDPMANKQALRCERGRMHVLGIHEVLEPTMFAGPCNVTSEGGELHLKAPIFFSRSVVFSGDLRVKSLSSLDTACVTVNGSITLQSGRVTVEGCRNHNNNVNIGAGGALHVAGDLRLRGGSLDVICMPEQGVAAWSGGAAHVAGNLDIAAGEFNADSCSAQESAGAVYVAGDVHVSGGTLQVKNASTGFGPGGALVARAAVHIAGGTVEILRAKAGYTAGALHASNIEVTSGSLRISDTQALQDAGAAYAENYFRMEGGTVEILRTKSSSSGGAVCARAMELSGGFLRVSGAFAHSSGGALATRSRFRMKGGVVEIRDSISELSGGGLHAREDIEITGGSMRISHTSATGTMGIGGGAICAQDAVRVDGGAVEVYNATTKLNGGAMSARNIYLLSGSLHFVNTSSDIQGGAVFAASNLEVTSGTLSATSTSALRSGGALTTKSLRIAGGAVEIRSARSGKHGGAIQAIRDTVISNGSLLVSGASAHGDGGALQTHDLHVTGGTVALHDVDAGWSGGAVKSSGDVSVSGNMTIARASAKNDGGAFFSRGAVHFSDGHVALQHVSAGRSGGAIFTESGLKWTGGILDLQDSLAGLSGGGVCSHGAIVMAGASAVFRRCSVSGGVGGAFYLPSGSFSASAKLAWENCTAKGGGDAVFASGDVKLGTATFVGSTASIFAGGQVVVAELRCWEADTCYAEGHESLHVASGAVTCPRGTGFLEAEGKEGCLPCPEGTTRLVGGNSTCQDCPPIPDATIGCFPSKLEIPAGFMVEMADLEWHRCPNAAACPGGVLKASMQLEDEAVEEKPVCLLGYAGPGCMQCAAGYAHADGNSLACIPCSESKQEAGMFVAFFLLKDIGLFLSAVATVTSAKREKSTSSAMLNQLMSFAAVATITMSGAMQTSSYLRMQESTKRWLDSLQLPVAFAGQGAGAKLSNQCLLGMLGYEMSFVNVHLLTSILPALLTVALVFLKGGWVAVVVGTNVFLPGFTAAFGRYLVAYRLRPEGMEGSALHMDFLPQCLSRALLVVLTAIAICFLAGAGSWTFAVRARKEPLAPHVAYLTQAYKPSCAAWEVERLVRKMLLALITAVLPVSLSPALQMGGIGLVLLVSSLLYVYFKPYKVKSWNCSEITLLFMALAMTTMTTCLIANDSHWARSASTQDTLIFAICCSAAGVTICMMITIAQAFYAERYGEA